MGDKTEYYNPMKPNKKICYAVIVVKSLQWPGKYQFYTDGRYLSIYVGNGHKYENVSYHPLHPPTVNDDPEEIPEQPEPNPLEEPPKEEEPPVEGEEVEGEEAEEDA